MNSFGLEKRIFEFVNLSDSNREVFLNQLEHKTMFYPPLGFNPSPPVNVPH